MGGHRQGEHHVSLVRHQIAPEPEDGQDHRHHKGGNQRQDKPKNNDPGQQGQEVAAQHPVKGHHLGPQCGGAGEHRQQNGNQIQGNHHPGCGPELMFQQFSQHLYTSRNSASTLMPFSSRMASTEDWRRICPRSMKSTSSSTFSTSAIRWVEMITEASGL